MRRKCGNCGNIFFDGSDCPNCKSNNTRPKAEDLTLHNRYASERMTTAEAIEFFETDKY